MHKFFYLLAQLDLGPLPNTEAKQAKITDTLNLALTIIGAITVLIIAIGGIRYSISRGDSKATAQAKDTILYAVIGLIVTMAAAAIVNFVVRGL